MDTHSARLGRNQPDILFTDVCASEHLRSLLLLSSRLVDVRSEADLMAALGACLDEELGVSEAIFIYCGSPELSIGFSGRERPLPADGTHALMATARACLRGVVARSGNHHGAIRIELGSTAAAMAVRWSRRQASASVEARDRLLAHAARLAGRALHGMRENETMRVRAEQVHLQELSRRDRLEAQMQVESLTDPMTGLTNRRGFFLAAEHALRLARRKGACSAVIFADVDNLKAVNDELGHAAGDALICDAAAVFRQSFRDADIVARLGGDEFVAFTLDDERPQAVLGRISTNIAQFNQADERPYAVSFSTGIVACDPLAKRSLADYLVMADQEMYERKQSRMH
jgi:diguanylate cyclase (GGDEF)-like protein